MPSIKDKMAMVAAIRRVSPKFMDGESDFELRNAMEGLCANAREMVKWATRECNYPLTAHEQRLYLEEQREANARLHGSTVRALHFAGLDVDLVANGEQIFMGINNL